MSETVLDRLLTRLAEALTYNANAQVAPAALLWPDDSSQWMPIISRIRERLPIVILGEYDPKSAQGPAYWIRCVVTGRVDAGLPAGRPIVYLPGVARSELRAVESCPVELAPISELQYRSQWFSHPNGKDWTVRSFLTHRERGLGLNVADDSDTGSVILLALDRLIDISLDRLNHPLDADFFWELINPDPVRSLLSWLDDPVVFRQRLDEAQWTAFVQQCKGDYGFDPSSSGPIVAAKRLGQREGKWANVWKRFAETPARYPGIPDRLRQAKPLELSFEPSEAWPQDNEGAEDQLRKQLFGFEAVTAEAARKAAIRLDEEHAWRRATVWAELDLSPLAFAVEQLARLSEVTAKPLASLDLEALTADYEGHGWQADDAVLRALAVTRDSTDRNAVESAVRAIYRPWLEAGAYALQSLISPLANDLTYQAGPASSKAKGAVTVFIDGLRLDVAHRVRQRLVGIGLEAVVSCVLSALPTVTETAKPAVLPVSHGVLVAGPDLFAANAATGTKATIPVLRALMTENQVQVLAISELGDPAGTAWTEAGAIDHRGHDAGTGLVDYLDEEVARITSRVRELLDHGWERVALVTDHGWILLPGEMEKVELPIAAAQTKKGRCARLKDGAHVNVPTVPWFWDKDVRIALAPGITCFEAGKEYEHGGVSPQECILPRILITLGATSKATGDVEITMVKWLGLLCRIELSGTRKGAVVDIRAMPGAPNTSVAEKAKDTGGTGRVTLVVPDDQHIGESAYVVLTDKDGQILAQREVVIGKNQ